MNALTLPRAAAALEYKALRLPAHLLETQIVAKYLADDSAVRLGFERALGSLDETAGRLLHDDGLTRRGSVLKRRADVLGQAVELEEKAARRKVEADEKLRSEQQQAAGQREKAEREQREKAEQVLAEEKAAKSKAQTKAASRTKADTKAVSSTAQAVLASERDRLEEQEARIENRTQARTAAPKAQLDDATAQATEAGRERQTADRLAELADDEKAGRAAARAAQA